MNPILAGILACTFVLSLVCFGADYVALNRVEQDVINAFVFGMLMLPMWYGSYRVFRDMPSYFEKMLFSRNPYPDGWTREQVFELVEKEEQNR